jgi:hypothetical protein
MTFHDPDLQSLQELLRGKEEELERLTELVRAYRAVIDDLEDSHRERAAPASVPKPLSPEEEWTRTQQVLGMLKRKGVAEARDLAALWNVTVEGAAKWLRKKSHEAPWMPGEHGRVFVLKP